MRTGNLKERRSMRLSTVTTYYSCLHYTVDNFFMDQRAMLRFLHDLTYSDTKSLAMKGGNLKSQKSAKIYGIILNLSPVLPHCFLAHQAQTQTTSWILMESS